MKTKSDKSLTKPLLNPITESELSGRNPVTMKLTLCSNIKQHEAYITICSKKQGYLTVSISCSYGGSRTEEGIMDVWQSDTQIRNSRSNMYHHIFLFPVYIFDDFLSDYLKKYSDANMNGYDFTGKDEAIQLYNDIILYNTKQDDEPENEYTPIPALKAFEQIKSYADDNECMISDFGA